MWLKIPVDLATDAASDHLLRELDRWIELGLLSENQSIAIGRTLCSTLPADRAPVEDLPDLSEIEAPPPFRRPLFSNVKSRLVQSMVAEMSVLWLLFLGVFLVVMSSGVLAASQWQSFSTVAQYAILLVYTLAFGGASRWAMGQEKLQTTAQMLKAATLLLIPLNFLMMDVLGVLQASVGLGILASVGLSALTLFLAPQRRVGFNLLGLGWLHWGWNLGLWPLAATYLGTVGSAITLLPSRKTAELADDEDPQSARPRAGASLVAVSLIILLVRSLWLAQVPLYSLGLACGICGWMLCRLYRRYSLWPQLGIGIMALGWLVSVAQQPLQALGVSGLGLWLLKDRLQRQSEEKPQLNTLATLWLVGLQAASLLWLVVPGRQAVLTAMGHFSPEPISALNFAGVWLYGYVGFMLLWTRRFRRQGQVAWARLTEHLALGVAVVLVLMTLPQSSPFTPLSFLSIGGLTLTLGALSRLRPHTVKLVYATHGAAVVTVLSGLHLIGGAGRWTDVRWAMVFLGLTLLEWFASVAGHRYPQWRRSAWYLGIALGAVTYSLLLNNWDSWLNLAWLGAPCMLTWLVHRPQLVLESPKTVTFLTVVALAGQSLLLSSWSMATLAFGVGTALLFLHSRRWPGQGYLPALTVGSAVAGGHAAAIWLWLHSAPGGQFCLTVASFAAVLTVLSRLLTPSPRALIKAYGAATRGWSRVLALGLWGIFTLMLGLAYALAPTVSNGMGYVGRTTTPEIDTALRYGAAAIILVLARFWGQRRLTNVDYGEFFYGLGLLVIMGLALWTQAFNPYVLGAAMVLLGLATQQMGAWAMKTRLALASWHMIPLIYALLGLGFGHFNFTAITGLYSMAAGTLALAVGKRQQGLHPFGYIGLGLLSLGGYELAIHRLLQSSGGAAGDGLTLLALVGVAIALLYLLGCPWIQRYTQLKTSAVLRVSTAHWLVAAALAILATASGQSRLGVALWLGCTSLLAVYAGLRGNYRWFPRSSETAPTNTASRPVAAEPSHHHNHRQWTWSGLIIATVTLPYAVDQLLPNFTLMRSWGSLLACGLSLGVHCLAWQRYGWPGRPWRRMALSWPLLAILFSVATVKTQSLLLVGAFYAAMAQRLRAVRLSYLSLGLLNWSLLRYLVPKGWFTPLGLGLLAGLSALYILEVDPHWQAVSARRQRHYLRCLASLLLGLTAILQAEISAPVFIGVSLGVGFGLMGMGLYQQVRAYLYIGTFTFMAQIARAVMMFVTTDGCLLWAIGIVFGIALIWIAATFESRRAQINDLLQRWSTVLDSWD